MITFQIIFPQLIFRNQKERHSVVFTIATLFVPIGAWFFSLLHCTDSLNSFALPGTGIMGLTLISAFFMPRGYRLQGPEAIDSKQESRTGYPAQAYINL